MMLIPITITKRRCATCKRTMGYKAWVGHDATGRHWAVTDGICDPCLAELLTAIEAHERRETIEAEWEVR